jgi:hypothetical protein
MAGHTPEQIETFVRQACKAIEQHLELKPKR